MPERLETGGLQLQVSALGENGEGVGRVEGEVYFVPGAIAGDVVAVKKSEAKHRAQWVSEFAIIRASPDRRPPYCAALSCGGCSLRVMELRAASEHKRQRVIDALQRIALSDVAVAPVVSDGQLAYRHRVRLHSDGTRTGYRKAGSHQVLALGACPVLEPALEQALRDIARICERFKVVGEIDAVAGDDRLALQIDPERDPEHAHKAAGELLKIAAGVIVADKKKHRRYGEPYVLRTHPSMSGPPRFYLEPGVFSQANWEMNKALVALVMAAVPPDAQVLELHAGAGNFTVPLAARQSVHATELDERAVMCARRNLEEHAADKRQPKGRIEVMSDVAASQLEGDVVVLDPPRTGAGRATEALVKKGRASRIVYVSCDPGTLARDVKTLESRYTLTQVTPVDMFPGTPHIEMVAVFDRKS